MPLRRVWLLPVLLLCASPLAAQALPISIAVEARVGRAVPLGDFASSEDGFASESGIAYAIGGSIFPIRAIGVFAGYQRSDFGCEQCALVGLDDSAIVDGIEAGIHLALPVEGLPVAPWVRGGIVNQTLAFQADGDEMSSEPEIGYLGAVGITIPVHRFIEISPSARYFTLPAEFEFPSIPEPTGEIRVRSIDVTAYSLDLGISFRY